MDIGQRIKTARLAANMTQKELAEKCGTVDSAIRKYESGKVTPKNDMLNKIADALGINVQELGGYRRRLTVDDLIEIAKTMPKTSSPTFSESDIQKLRDLFKPSLIEARKSLPSREEMLALAYNMLNEKGQIKVVEFAADLTEIPRYQKTPPQAEARDGENADDTPQEGD